jgi:hypothetical protein
LAIQGEPRALPLPTDCPFAADSVQLILGQPAVGLRETVRSLSAAVVSCPHLNDATRCLADLPTLVSQLRVTPPPRGVELIRGRWQLAKPDCEFLFKRSS